MKTRYDWDLFGPVRHAQSITYHSTDADTTDDYVDMLMDSNGIAGEVVGTARHVNFIMVLVKHGKRTTPYIINVV